ncbi:hypothetical protein EXIGLDRAFT_843763 [Exidia glandulosa HHB12029]|uniref:Uncharacterized protein n=1 Tax=Exidia glandulosa HHB12029 TaxID=1314781 RepID=A0A165CGK3_EXIGL|nr:hypothetical protein EXIGLDRAFT_843763 [Exidia glandulosa HHB12029]
MEYDNQRIPYRRTSTQKASMEFDYIGADVYLCFVGIGASYAFTVDGNLITETRSSADPACSKYIGAETLLFSSGMSMGKHSARLTFSSIGTEDFRFFGGIVSMGVTSSSTQLRERHIDDVDAGWAMVPGRGDSWSWQTQTDAPSANLINNTHSFTCIYDGANVQSATYNFTGAGGVVLRGTIGVGLQPYTIELNDEVIPLDATSVVQYAQSVNLFFRGGLDPSKQYTISLRNWNENYPYCNRLYYLPPTQPLMACCANLDGLVLLSEEEHLL